MRPVMRSRPAVAALALFAVAWLVRFLYLTQISRSPFFDLLQLDPLYYFTWAQRIAAGDWIGGEVFEMSPLYSYLLALYLIVAGPDLWLLRLLQIGVGAGTCVLTFLLGRRLFGLRAGVLAGAGCALYGPFLFYEGQVMKEFLTPPLATGALLLALPATPLSLAGAGGLIGLAALVRDNFLLLLVVLCGWALYATRGWRAPAALLAGALAVLLPVGVRNWAVGGDFVLTTSGGGEVFYIGNGPYANGAYVPPPWVRSNPQFEHEDFRAKARELTGRSLSRAEASRFWWKQGMSWIAANPGRAAILWLRKLALFWNDHELPDNYAYGTFVRFAPLLRWMLTFGPVAALAVAGIALSASDGRRMLPLWLAAAGYMVSVLLFFNFARFRLPIVPILLVFAARGVEGVYEAVRGRRRALVAAVMAIAAVPFLYVDWSSAWEEPFQDRLHLGAAYRQAGRHAEAEQVLRAVIADAEAVVRRHGGDPARGGTVPGGVTFVSALSAAHRDLAGVLRDTKRPAEAAEEYRRAAALMPREAAIHLHLAAALREAGDLPGALAAARTAVGLQPGSFHARFDLATVHYEMGRYPEALEELERARRAGGDLPPLDLADYHYGMGAVLYAMGRVAEAAPHFTEGLRLNPDAPGAAGAREALAAPGGVSSP